MKSHCFRFSHQAFCFNLQVNQQLYLMKVRLTGKCVAWLKVILHLRSHGTTATNPMPGRHAHTVWRIIFSLWCMARFKKCK